MKVKDLIKSLEAYGPEKTVVMKNLYANPLEPAYIMKKVRVYSADDKIIIDGYDKHILP